MIRQTKESQASDAQQVMKYQQSAHDSSHFANQTPGRDECNAMERWYNETADEEHWNPAARFPDSVGE